MKSRRLFVLLVLLAIVGCGKNELAQKPKQAATNLEDVVFAVVNGRPLTAAAVRDAVNVDARVLKLAKKAPEKKDFARWANRRAVRLMPMLVSGYLWEEEVRREGIVPLSNDCALVLSGYNRRANRKAANIDELAPKFGKLEGYFRNQFERECLFAAYARERFDDSVSDRELSDFYLTKTNDLRRAARIDAEAAARSQEAWSKLHSGVAWEKVAEEYSEDTLIDEGNSVFAREWGRFRPQDFGADALGALLQKLKAGEYSKPTETDEGMLIVRVNAIENGVYSCARIIFRMAQPVVVPEPDEAREQLKNEKLLNAQRTLIRRLRSEAKIEYPMGTNFVYRIWKDFKPKRGAKPKQAAKPKKINPNKEIEK